MRNLFRDYFSHRTLFYGLFNDAAKNIVKMAIALNELVKSASLQQQEVLYKQINAMEETGDDITHKVYLSLDKIYFTPFNRKDIHILASAIDDVADNIHESAGRMNNYNLPEIIPPIKEIASYILQCCIEIEKLVIALSDVKDVESLLASCKQIKNFESQTDQVYYRALADLFANQKDAIELIKYRDVLHSLETSANKCKSATDAIEIILLNSI